MIHVCQGHEKSISIEVFLKSILSLNQNQVNNILFHCSKTSLKESLNLLKIKHQFHNNELKINNKIIKCNFINETNHSQTVECIISAIKNLSKDDILLTLPSSKDQFNFNNVSYNGHTEFLRSHYNNHDISMCFLGPKMNMLLLTDHIPLNQVVYKIDLNTIVNKISLSLKQLTSLISFKSIIISGINPHAGEDGLLGVEDGLISHAIEILKVNYPEFNFKGPIPSDTLQFNYNHDSDLVVYTYHDQGLNTFKTLNGLLGINLTLGLPYLRVSPDHGTAFNLYGKNIASYHGLNYLLSRLLK